MDDGRRAPWWAVTVLAVIAVVGTAAIATAVLHQPAPAALTVTAGSDASASGTLVGNLVGTLVGTGTAVDNRTGMSGTVELHSPGASTSEPVPCPTIPLPPGWTALCPGTPLATPSWVAGTSAMPPSATPECPASGTPPLPTGLPAGRYAWACVRHAATGPVLPVRASALATGADGGPMPMPSPPSSNMSTHT